MPQHSERTEKAHTEYAETITQITDDALSGLDQGTSLANIVQAARIRHKSAYRRYLKALRTPSR